MRRWRLPWLIIGSMVKIMPGFRTTPCPFCRSAGLAGLRGNRVRCRGRKILVRRVACVFGNLLAGVADVAQGRAGFDGGDARHHGFVGNVNQALGDGETLPTVNIRLESPWKPSFDGQVDVNDVAFFERLVVGNAVADDVVDGGAAGFGVGRVAVVQGAG